jgi:hypothetical protein
MKNWNCIKPHIENWTQLIGVDPFDTKEFITSLNKQTGEVDRLANISASQIGKGVIYVAMMLQLHAASITQTANILGHQTNFPIALQSNTEIVDNPTKSKIAHFVDKHIEVCKGTDVLFKTYRPLKIEVKDTTTKFRAGATSKALAHSNRLMRPLGLRLDAFFRDLKEVTFDNPYWNEHAFKRKKTSKKQVVLERLLELEEVHLMIDVPSWGDNLNKYFLDPYTDNHAKHLSTLFYLMYASNDLQYIKLLRHIGGMLIDVEEILNKMQSLAHTIVDEAVDELWLVKREGYVRVSNIKQINDYVDIISISTGRANAQLKSIFSN